MIITKLIPVFLLVTTMATANEIKINASLKFYTSEELVFHSKEEFPLSDIGKIRNYQGFLTQAAEPKADLANADIYTFKNESKIAVTEELCKTYTTKIFGDFKTRKAPIKQTLELFKTTTGKSCEVNLQDPSAKKQYRQAIIGFAHGQLVALVWTQKNPPTQESTQKIKSYYQSLR